MTRYVLSGNWKAAPDNQGEWVLWRDVRDALTTAGELAIERDRYRKERDRYRQALVDIAAIPLTLPSAAAGVARAKDALDR